MEWLNELKEKFSKRRIRNLDRKEYRRDFIDIDKAKRIGMIVNVNQLGSEDLKLLRNYIDALKKRSKELFAD